METMSVNALTDPQFSPMELVLSKVEPVMATSSPVCPVVAFQSKQTKELIRILFLITCFDFKGTGCVTAIPIAKIGQMKRTSLAAICNAA